jgi:hypothetical protein
MRCLGPYTPHLSSVNVLKCSITLCYVGNSKKRKTFGVPSCVFSFRAESHINSHRNDSKHARLVCGGCLKQISM